MSKKNDRRHFAEYTDQNKAKHEILTSYYPAYLKALKNQAQRFHFIDAFAGPGHYAGDHPGSPLLALEAMAKAGVLGRSTISCVENQQDFAEGLRQAINKLPQKPALLMEELVRDGTFHTHVDEILGRAIYQGLGKVATFAFVDPCGVDGVRMKDLARILKLDFGEVLLLFNFDGVNRLLGGLEKGTHDDAILVELFGSAERLRKVRDRVQKHPREKELSILDEFTASLKAESKARYFLPFRFKAKAAAKSSHYLIHCSNNCLAFKIMKSVMWKAGRTEAEDKYGRLEFLSDHERGATLDLVRVEIEDQKAKVLERVKSSTCEVSEFTINWVCKPTDIFSDKVYKQMLLDLEGKGKLLVYDKDNNSPSPSSRRRRLRGEPTLGDDYWLRTPK